jgi:cell wall-associated NlpC family hydrolase
MKFLKLIILLFLLVAADSFAQKIIKHKVKSGESIYSIAKKYDVTQSEIYAMNPKLKGAVLGLNTEVKIKNKKYKERSKVLKNEVASTLESQNQINNSEKKTTETASKGSHLVLAKETIYSISKKYGITMEMLCELNPALKTSNLKKGMQLQLPSTEESPVPEKVMQEQNSQNVTTTPPLISNVDIVHKVLPKETLYGISRQTGVSIEELTRLNPEISNGLKIDQLLIIQKGTAEKVENRMEVTEAQKEIETAKPLSAENLSKAEFLIEKASEHMGTRYRRGGTSPGGFDCSGFVLHTFKHINFPLPRTSHEMGGCGQRVEKSQAQKGDLIFFATFGKGRISHVGMVTEVNEDEIKFIHSSTSSGVIISSTKENYYAKSFVKINRVLKD